MNKEFVRKMIMAEQLKYEAIKEILPENIRKKVDNFEKEAFELIKEVAFEIIKEKVVDTNSSTDKEHAAEKTRSKKVKVDFI